MTYPAGLRWHPVMAVLAQPVFSAASRIDGIRDPSAGIPQDTECLPAPAFNDIRTVS